MADAGQLHLESEPVYINEILEEACALVAPRARARNISIVRDLNQEVAYVGDEASLHRSEEHTSELQSRLHLVCRLLLEKKKLRHYHRSSFPHILPNHS